MDKLTVEEKAELVEVYEKAADWIETYGWFQNGDAAHASCRSPKAACFAVAIQHIKAIILHDALMVASEMLELDMEGPWDVAGAIFRWNDEDGRTEDEVINTLHALANKLR